MNANLRNFALWVIIVLLLLALFTLFQNPGTRPSAQDISFSQLLTEVDAGKVRDVLIQGPDIHGTFTDGRTFQTYAPSDPTLVQRLYGKGVAITARPQGDSVPWFVSLLVSWLPFIALIGVWIFLSRMQGAGKAGARARLLEVAEGYLNRSIGRLNDARLEVRLGAVYTLRRIAWDFPDLAKPTVELLSVYLCEKPQKYESDLPPPDLREIMETLGDHLVPGSKAVRMKFP